MFSRSLSQSNGVIANEFVCKWNKWKSEKKMAEQEPEVHRTQAKH